MHIHPSSPNSSQSEDTAATKIQAGFRGFRVRKQLKHKTIKPQNQRITSAAANDQNQKNTNRSTTISLEDKCAAKIQAGVRGFLVRKNQKLENGPTKTK